MKKFAIALAVGVSLSASAQSVRYQERAAFGADTVTVKITNAYDYCVGQGDMEQRLIGEEDPTEQERLARLLWDCGDSWQLTTLAQLHERRMDLVGAYAHLFAADRIAKMSRRYHPTDIEVRGQYHAIIAQDLARIGGKISASQRGAAIKQAAQLIRDNPNCCMAM